MLDQAILGDAPGSSKMNTGPEMPRVMHHWEFSARLSLVSKLTYNSSFGDIYLDMFDECKASSKVSHGIPN